MKRTLFIIGFFLLYTLIVAVNWLFLFLDEIFYHSYRKIKIQDPVFIIGMPRTGSTFLHNVLSGDRERFTTMKLWESMLCPSIIQKRMALFFFSSEWFHYSKVHSFLTKTDRFFFRDFYPLHPTGLLSIEEDDSLFLPLFASQTLVYLLPRQKFFSNLAFFDEKFGKRRKTMIMKFYRKMIQKHLFVFGRDKIYLTKSPYHTARMDSLRKTFPGIRFICLTREPERAIPSTIGLLTRLCKIYHTSADIGNVRERVLLAADHWYYYPLRIFSRLSVNSFMVIDFNYLIHSPEDVIHDIYDHFGFIASDAMLQQIKAEIGKASGYRSGQEYSPEKYGLDPDVIRSRYQNIYEELIKLSRNGSRQETDVPFSLVKNR